MTVGFVSLGTEEDLLDSTFSGFAFGSSKSVLPLIENEVGTIGNAVIQQASLGFRQAALTFIARDTAEKDVIRGYDETGETVAFVDFDGSTRSVMVYDFSSSLRFGDVWDISVTLLEFTAPEPLGS